MKPKMSEEAQLNGAFDHNHTPLEPTGTKAIIHGNSLSRETWDIQGIKGWYISGAPDYYQCWKIYATNMAS